MYYFCIFKILKNTLLYLLTSLLLPYSSSLIFPFSNECSDSAKLVIFQSNTNCFCKNYYFLSRLLKIWCKLTIAIIISMQHSCDAYLDIFYFNSLFSYYFKIQIINHLADDKLWYNLASFVRLQRYSNIPSINISFSCIHHHCILENWNQLLWIPKIKAYLLCKL